MAEYQKILQLYRATNIWDTKNIAKAEVERHAKLLHAELGAQLRDGEPIVAKYYDPSEGYTFAYAINGTGSGTDPYGNTSESAKHVWVGGFDSFDISEWDETHLKPKNKESVDYDSAAYVRVKNNNNDTYYKLNITPPQEVAQRDKSAVFGVALQIGTDDLTIEWFDSSAEAKGVIGELSYNDKDLTNGFVALVNQKDGKIESVHGTISGENATVVTDNAYNYTELDNQSLIPDDYIWIPGTNEDSELPSRITEDSPKYFHDTTNNKYYELRKNVSLTLLIGDNHNTGNNNILYQDANGLKTNINLRTLTSRELEELTDAANVKEAFKLVGAADGTEKQIGETIKIYKDNSLYGAYVGTTSDTFLNGRLKTENQTVVFKWVSEGENPKSVYTISEEPVVGEDMAYYEGSTDFVFIKPENIEVFEEGKIKVGGVDYIFNSEGIVPFVLGSDSGEESLSFVYILSDGTYELVNVNIENFLQESEFTDGLLVDNHVVKVRLAGDAGIEFKTEQTGNKSLKIKIDSTPSNTYYREIRTGETVESVNRYNYVGVGASGADEYGYKQDDSGSYVKDQYLDTTSNGLAVDQDVLENKITDNVSKVLYVNNEQFVKDNNGNIRAIITGNDIKIAGAGSTIPNVDKTEIYGDTHEWSYIANPGSNSPDYIITGVNSIMTLMYRNNGEYTNYPQQMSPQQNLYKYIEANGLIFKWNGNAGHDAYELFFIDKDTNLNDAISIVEYLVYNIDMGMFTN